MKAILLACALLVTAGRVEALLDDTLEFLRTRAVVAAPADLDRMALEAVLHAVDPLATLGDAVAPTNGQVVAECLAEGILYARVVGVATGTCADVVAALAMPSKTNCAGVILDFRGAAGAGYADAARIGGIFAGPSRDLITVYDAHGEFRQSYRGDAGTGICPVAPVMVLVDGRTCGAAEVLAAVLKRQPGIMLVGRTTVGDWRVRETLTLPGNITATFATGYAAPTAAPAGTPIGGVEPHVAVAERQVDLPPMPARRFDGRPMSAEAQADRELMLRVGEDPALLRATEILLGLKALGTRRPAAASAARVAAGNGAVTEPPPAGVDGAAEAPHGPDAAPEDK